MDPRTARFAAALLLTLLPGAGGHPARPREGEAVVGYLGFAAPTAEDSAAHAWLSSAGKFRAVPLTLEGPGPATKLPDLRGIDLLWIHIPDSADYERWKPRLGSLTPLKTWYENGGRFLFTGLAAMIPHAIGIETVGPSIEPMDVEDDWLFDQKGFQGYRPDISPAGAGHPVFAGLFGGVFTWDAVANHRLWRAGYFGDRWPSEGRVAGVEKAYITISGDRKLLVEYGNGRGRGIAAGGFVFFGRPNHRRDNLTRFVENALEYAAGDGPAPAPSAYWAPRGTGPVPVAIPAAVLDTLARARGGGPEPGDRASAWTPSDLVIRRDSATRNFYDVAGRRAVVMGKESGGIDEVWTHPFRLLRDYRAGLAGADSVAWLDGMPARLEIRPEALTRIYSTPAGEMREVVFTARDEPSAVVHYEFRGTGRARVVVRFRTDLRQMWPYDAPATGALRYGVDPGRSGATLMVTDGPGLSWGLFGADAEAAARITGPFDSVWWAGGRFDGSPSEANQVWHAAAYDIDAGGDLNLVMTGGSGGYDAVSDHAALLARPARAHDAARRACEGLIGGSVAIRSPDAEFNELFAWAIVGTDRFAVNTPGVGEGLLAGYSTTARGWDGAQKISGRPGYAWYFGRDAAWSGFAIDDYGDFATVKRELELLQRYQDISGKIFHEISTSGSVHYDASDATPLYVQLAAHYLRASGDTAFLRASWPRIRKAMDYLYSTDTDGDGLIENTREGHGWVEGGALYPVHTEFYLAGAWGKALLDASYIASVLGLRDDDRSYGIDGHRVRGILNRDFWNPETRSFNLGKKADGTYNTEPTVLPATVMYYNLLDDEKVRPVLELYAGSGFTSDWGVRIVSSRSPLFNPQGYHYGSVWPLFTGWTALAEYEYGNSTQGFTHILNNLYIKNHWALGFVEEVMNGAVYKPSGVCPHQCWSETNILHPAITGMVGWKPDAPAGRAGLFPRLPVQWDSFEVRNLRIGGSTVDAAMAREAGRTTWRFSKEGGGRLTLDFAPELPDGMTITRVLLDGREARVPAGMKRGLVDPPLTVGFAAGPGGPEEHTLVIEHTGGIGVVPAMPRPEPGDSSTGHRIISEGMRDGVYEVVVEGMSGSTAAIEMKTFDLPVDRVGNARILEATERGSVRLEVPFPAGRQGYVTTTVRVSIGAR